MPGMGVGGSAEAIWELLGWTGAAESEPKLFSFSMESVLSQSG